jgi:hypothetical protein
MTPAVHERQPLRQYIGVGVSNIVHETLAPKSYTSMWKMFSFMAGVIDTGD